MRHLISIYNNPGFSLVVKDYSPYQILNQLQLFIMLANDEYINDYYYLYKHIKIHRNISLFICTLGPIYHIYQMNPTQTNFQVPPPSSVHYFNHLSKDFYGFDDIFSANQNTGTKINQAQFFIQIKTVIWVLPSIYIFTSISDI